MRSRSKKREGFVKVEGLGFIWTDEREEGEGLRGRRREGGRREG